MTYFRRAPELVVSWKGHALILRNYRTRQTAPVRPVMLDVLDYCAEWRSPSQLRTRFAALPRKPLGELLSLLAAHTFLEQRTRRPRAPTPAASASWQSWDPEAACFHFGTKDVRYGPPLEMHAALVEKARHEPPPPPTKSYRRATRTRLPPPRPVEGLSRVLNERRSWRRFADNGAVDIATVATLLGQVWGIQKWAHTELGRCALKSSPSGGARHCTEVYLLAQNVAGLAPGRYYYDPDGHDLVRLSPTLEPSQLEAYLAGQSCYARVPAVFVMTAVFPRVQWRYDFPRAYRVVLLEAGHFCQTFLLAATALGLAPFCSAALADSLIERDLALDGVTESVIYACGVGLRPDGTDWAPWPDTTAVPPLTSPRWSRSARR